MSGDRCITIRFGSEGHRRFERKKCSSGFLLSNRL